MLSGYERSTFRHAIADGRPVEHDVYTKGDGPVVVLLQELPGISAETLALADRLCGDGFRVVMPHLFGPLGKFSLAGNLARVMCMRREFHLFSRNASSPIVDWLRALCRQVRAQYEVSGVGVIGMCLTGNFAISLMADESVLASVASQPSLPLLGTNHLHMSSEDVAAARARLTERGPMLALRFEKDIACTAGKFEALEATFNRDQERITTRTLPGRGHSVLTVHFVDSQGSPTAAALREVLDYFHSKLDVIRS